MRASGNALNTLKTWLDTAEEKYHQPLCETRVQEHFVTKLLEAICVGTDRETGDWLTNEGEQEKRRRRSQKARQGPPAVNLRLNPEHQWWSAYPDLPYELEFPDDVRESRQSGYGYRLRKTAKTDDEIRRVAKRPKPIFCGTRKPRSATVELLTSRNFEANGSDNTAVAVTRTRTQTRCRTSLKTRKLYTTTTLNMLSGVRLCTRTT